MDEVETIAAREGSKSKGSHKWTRTEDETMLQHLLEMSLDRYWKPEGIFKSGWTTELLMRMKVNWPDCPIEVKHIENRHKYLKEKYYAISEMLKQTSIGGSICSWNQDSCLIECDKQWFLEWVKTHKKAGGLYGTPFPYYNILDKIYSRDRARGDVVETLNESASESLPHADSTFDGEGTSRGSKRKSDSNDTTAVKPLAKKGRRKDNSDAANERFTSCYESSMGELNSHISVIASAMDREQTRLEMDIAKDAELKNKIMDDLEKVDGLTFREIVFAARTLLRDAVQYALYEKVGDEKKFDFIKMLLEESGYPNAN